MVDSEILLSILKCVGKTTPEGEYENPYAEVVIDPEGKGQKTEPDQVAFTIDVLRGDVVFKFVTQYREATAVLDEPSFSVTVRNEANEVMKTITEDFDPNIIRDRYYHFDTTDGALYFAVPNAEFSDYSEKTLWFEMTAKLERWEWTPERTKGEQLETISETKTVRVDIMVADVQHIILSAAPIQPKWRHAYQLMLTVQNNGTERVGFGLSCTETSEYEPDDDIGLALQLAQGVCPNDCIHAGGTQRYLLDSPRKKEWPWHTVLLCDCVYDISATARNYAYTFRLLITSVGQDETTSELIEMPIVLSVIVDQTKIDCAERADYALMVVCNCRILAIELYFLAALMLLTGISAWLAPAYGALASAEMVMSVIWDGVKQVALNEIANGCPVPFDAAYKTREQPRTDTGVRKPGVELPAELEDLLVAQDRTLQLHSMMRTAFNRYTSARRENDREAASMQKQYAEALSKELHIETETLRELALRAKRSVHGKLTSIHKQDLDIALRELRKREVPSETRAVLGNKGFTEAEIQVAIEKLRNASVDDLLVDMRPSVEQLNANALLLHQSSLITLERIEEIDSMSDEDVALELMLAGLISSGDYSKRRSKTELASNYLIAEISEIPHRDKLRLADAEVYTTRDLLHRCRDDREIGKLSAATRINRSDISRWVGLTGLMRIRGIGEADAILLQATGIRDVASLKRTRPDRLREKMKAQRLKAKARVRLPSKKAISKWIGSAAEASKPYN